MKKITKIVFSGLAMVGAASVYSNYKKLQTPVTDLEFGDPIIHASDTKSA